MSDLIPPARITPLYLYPPHCYLVASHARTCDKILLETQPSAEVGFETFKRRGSSSFVCAARLQLISLIPYQLKDICLLPNRESSERTWKNETNALMNHFYTRKYLPDSSPLFLRFIPAGLDDPGVRLVVAQPLSFFSGFLATGFYDKGMGASCYTRERQNLGAEFGLLLREGADGRNSMLMDYEYPLFQLHTSKYPRNLLQTLKQQFHSPLYRCSGCERKRVARLLGFWPDVSVKEFSS